MASFSQGFFTPKNPDKYIGKGRIRYRSSWESYFMTFLDSNPNIQHWASESIVIPYIHPFTGKRTNYVPDFLVVYANKNGQQKAEIVEVKPKNQSIVETKQKSTKIKMIVAINHAKWKAASAYCKANGMTFRVIDETQMFHQGKAPKVRRGR